MAVRGRRIDANQNKVVKELRQIPGITVAITSKMGDGFPDLVVGYKKRNYLIELKDPAKPPSGRKLTDDEVDFHMKWKGHITIAMTTEEILTELGIT